MKQLKDEEMPHRDKETMHSLEAVCFTDIEGVLLNLQQTYRKTIIGFKTI